MRRTLEDTIGNTPLVRLQRLPDSDRNVLLAKLEGNNPAVAIINLFYWNNAFHDILKRYGFNEAADNFQTINYGGGAFSNGDYVRAEAADGSGTNNANFSTPAQGGSPRMQM